VNPTRRAVLAVALGGAMACQRGTETARAAAEGFLDEHYVRMDLAAARRYCVGRAEEKVAEEQHLVGDQQIDAATRRPHVSYRLVEERPEGDDRVALLYDATVRFDDGATLELRWLVTARRDAAGAWKVSNYEELH
jgi:hypothetical protein